MKRSIFEPIQIGPLKVKNRIEVAPAAPFLAAHDGSVSQELYEYTMNLAKSGAGIVTIGVSGVDPREGIGGRVLSVASPLYLSGLSDLAEGIHRYGAAASIELVHSRYMLTPPEKVVNETTTEQVEEIIALFANAAALAQTAGFDMIMIHGGHGNVPSMFFSAKYNRRTDRFGGDFNGRCRFGQELLSAVRERTGGKLAIEYRISAEEMLPGMTGLEETLEYARAIEGSIDLLHVSRGLLEEDELLPYINAPLYLPKAMNQPYAKRFKEALSVPVSVVGSFDLDAAEQAVSCGDVDMVAMIRTVLADTDCVEKARRGRDDEIRPCIRCNTCISRTHSEFKTVRCAVNPLVGVETRFRNAPAAVSKHAVVIGGGPAGLEAARTLSSRGHKVTLLERSGELGGLFRLAGAAEIKRDLRRYLDWSVNSVLNDSNICVKMNADATRDIVAEEKPDAIFVAVGSRPILPSFTATGTNKVIWAGDAEADTSRIGDDVIVAGAGFTGMELALTLAREGKSVRMLDMLAEDEIGAGGSPINLICLKQLLSDAGVRFVCGVRITDIDSDGVHISSDEGARVLTCDTAILSFGFKPDEAAVTAFDGIVHDTFVIGDACGTGGTVRNAVRTAFDRAMQL